jgi:hypothetical protein
MSRNEAHEIETSTDTAKSAEKPQEKSHSGGQPIKNPRVKVILWP